jgi:hypothetical protein
MDAAQLFVDHSRKFLTESYLPRIERSIERLSDADIWWRGNDGSNSVGNLVLHLAGNVRQWIVSGIGGAPDRRRRQEEFDERGPVPREELLRRLRDAVLEADAVLGSLGPGRLTERSTIQGREVGVLYAIYHVVEHFSMHTGQIIYFTKMRAGDLAFYEASSSAFRETWTSRTR